MKTTITLSGPFFSNDPDRLFDKNVVDMLDAVAAEQEREVRGQIASHAGQMPHYSGWSTEHVVGRVESLQGHQWHRHAVVSANTEGSSRRDSIRTRAAAAGIERRWHPFRRVATATRKAIRDADLTKGMS